MKLKGKNLNSVEEELSKLSSSEILRLGLNINRDIKWRSIFLENLEEEKLSLRFYLETQIQADKEKYALCNKILKQRLENKKNKNETRR